MTARLRAHGTLGNGGGRPEGRPPSKALACCEEGYADAPAGSSTRRGRNVSRAMTSRWICEVPS